MGLATPHLQHDGQTNEQDTVVSVRLVHQLTELVSLSLSLSVYLVLVSITDKCSKNVREIFAFRLHQGR
jgi:hypothetical protein